MTPLVGQQQGHAACKKLGVALLVATGVLNVLQLQLSPPPPLSLAPIKSRMGILWHQLTQVHLGKWLLIWKEGGPIRTKLFTCYIWQPLDIKCKGLCPTVQEIMQIKCKILHVFVKLCLKQNF